MNDFPLTEDEIQQFTHYVGREINTSLLLPWQVRWANYIVKRESNRAKLYSRRVWSKFSLPNYLTQESQKCAKYAFEIFINDKNASRRTYSLNNPHGSRYQNLGFVHFRKADEAFIKKLNNHYKLSRTPHLAIERIELHPSIQRHGFLTSLIAELEEVGFKMLVLQCVANPSLAFHYYQKSLDPNSKVFLLSELNTVQFKLRISPCPSFGLLLNE
jgi:hypothetical protein